MHMRSAALIFAGLVAVGDAWGGNAATAGKLTEELPTIKCLGAYELDAQLPHYGPRR